MNVFESTGGYLISMGIFRTGLQKTVTHLRVISLVMRYEKNVTHASNMTQPVNRRTRFFAAWLPEITSADAHSPPRIIIRVSLSLRCIVFTVRFAPICTHIIFSARGIIVRQVTLHELVCEFGISQTKS